MMTGSVLTVHSSTHYLVVMMALHYCETRPLSAKTSSQLTTHLLLAALLTAHCGLPTTLRPGPANPFSVAATGRDSQTVREMVWGAGN